MFENVFQKYVTAKNVIFFVITILFLIFISKIQDIAIMFFASYVIACSLNPLADKLSKKMKRKTSVLIVLFGFLIIICAFFVPITAMALHEIKAFALMFPEYINNIKDFILTNPKIAQIDFSKVDTGGLLSKTGDFTSGILNSSIAAGKNIGSGLVYLIVSVIITYYFMADKELIRKTYLSMFPSNMQKKALSVIESISNKTGGYVVAQIATMASVGLIMMTGLALIKVEYALLLGLITSVLDIIPVIGPGIALIICLVASYKYGAGVLTGVIIIFAIAQLCENNIVRPYIFGKLLNLHPLIIYLFLFITAKYFGITGVIFAPAIAATVVVLIEELYIKSIK